MENLLSPQRVAAVLDCKRGHVYKLIREGELAAVKFGPRMVRVAETELKRYRDSKCKKLGDSESTGASGAPSPEKEYIASAVSLLDRKSRMQKALSANSTAKRKG